MHTADLSANVDPSRAHRRAGGIKAKLLTLLAILLIAVGVLPIIVVKTTLRNVLVSWALPRDAVQISIGDGWLSWFSSPSLSTVEVKELCRRHTAHCRVDQNRSHTVVPGDKTRTSWARSKSYDRSFT